MNLTIKYKIQQQGKKLGTLSKASNDACKSLGTKLYFKVTVYVTAYFLISFCNYVDNNVIFYVLKAGDSLYMINIISVLIINI